MSYQFDDASGRARELAHACISDGISATIVADALINQALSAWAADTGREMAAEEMLQVWTMVRDESDGV